MKILFYSPHPHLGLYDKAGYATHMQMVIAALRKNGHEVQTLIAGGESEAKDNSQQSSKSKSSRLKQFLPAIVWESLKDLKLLWFDKKMQKHLQQRIAQFKPDMVYERINYFQLSGVKACKQSGVLHMSEINSPYTEERVYLQGKTAFMRWAKRREKKLFSLTDKVIVVSSSLQAYFTNKYSFAKNKITVIPNAVDPELQRTSLKPIKPEIEQQLQGKTVIGFVGSIAPWHGIDRLLFAIADLKEKQHSLVFLIVGGGQDLDMYKQRAKDFGIQNMVVWTGSIPSADVFPLIQRMNITVMPDSNWYGSPIKIFEYGLLQKPIIAPNYAPLTDVMVHGQDGLLISRDSNALPEAILQLVNDKNQGELMGKSFYAKIISNFTWAQVASRIVTEAQQIK